MLSYDPEKRPSAEELKNHPWMQMPFDHKKAKAAIIETLKENKSSKSTQESDSISRSGARQQKSAALG